MLLWLNALISQRNHKHSRVFRLLGLYTPIFWPSVLNLILKLMYIAELIHLHYVCLVKLKRLQVRNIHSVFDTFGHQRQAIA